MPKDDPASEALLAAYADGVAELTADERRRVEELLQSDASARAEVEAQRDLLGQLRALPAEGEEPDWHVLEQQIRSAVGPIAPRPWWRRWFWLAPVGALAATAAGALLFFGSAHTHEVTFPPVAPHVEKAAPAPEAGEGLVWVDGDAIDVDDVDPSALPDELANEDGSGSSGVLPAADLNWVDQLDDQDLERVETWLAKRKS